MLEDIHNWKERSFVALNLKYMYVCMYRSIPIWGLVTSFLLFILFWHVNGCCIFNFLYSDIHWMKEYLIQRGGGEGGSIGGQGKGANNLLFRLMAPPPIYYAHCNNLQYTLCNTLYIYNMIRNKTATFLKLLYVIVFFLHSVLHKSTCWIFY